MSQPLQLLFAAASPFVRKVCIVASETDRPLERVAVFASPLEARPELVEINPLGKIPALRIPSGEALYGSAVICRFLGEGSLLYPQGDALWRALRREALADGLIEAALLARYETIMRPAEKQWQDWTDGQMSKITRALGAMQADLNQTSTYDIGDIATGCALGYLDFRYPDLNWRRDFPALAAYGAPILARAAFQQNAPA